jgi:hypothetical protein
MSDLTDRLDDAYVLVSAWPEQRMRDEAAEDLGQGFVDLLSLRNLVPEAAARIRELEAQVATLTAERDAANAALLPFAQLALMAEEYRHGEDSTCEWRIPFCDLRRARAALGTGGGDVG